MVPYSRVRKSLRGVVEREIKKLKTRRRQAIKDGNRRKVKLIDTTITKLWDMIK